MHKKELRQRLGLEQSKQGGGGGTQGTARRDDRHCAPRHNLGGRVEKWLQGKEEYRFILRSFFFGKINNLL